MSETLKPTWHHKPFHLLTANEARELAAECGIELVEIPKHIADEVTRILIRRDVPGRYW